MCPTPPTPVFFPVKAHRHTLCHTLSLLAQSSHTANKTLRQERFGEKHRTQSILSHLTSSGKAEGTVVEVSVVLLYLDFTYQVCM